MRARAGPTVYRERLLFNPVWGLATVLFWGWHLACVIGFFILLVTDWPADVGQGSYSQGLALMGLASLLGDFMLTWGGGAVAFGSMIWAARRRTLVRERPPCDPATVAPDPSTWPKDVPILGTAGDERGRIRFPTG